MREWRHAFTRESLMGQVALGLLQPGEVFRIVSKRIKRRRMGRAENVPRGTLAPADIRPAGSRGAWRWERD